MAIVAILMIAAVAILNPAAQRAKANDVRRKTDIGRIKVAFEEYFNDTGCYPNGAMLTKLLDDSNCKSEVFAQWGLNSWPCDPVTKTHYDIQAGTNINCPSWYKIYTKLENRNDAQIPPGWYSAPGNYSVGISEPVNYGVSSPNVLWYQFDQSLPPQCATNLLQCYRLDSKGNFISLGAGVFYNAYTNNCSECKVCLVSCCHDGSVCQ
jgi:type II secretory pathway pseudopilin PulG